MTLLQIPDTNNWHNVFVGELDDPIIISRIWGMARGLAIAELISAHQEEFDKLETEKIKKLIDDFTIGQS